MFKVKLSVSLPLLFCGIEAALWYWEAYSHVRVPPDFLALSPPFAISSGLDFPATVFTMMATIFFAVLGLFLSTLGPPRFASFWPNLFAYLSILLFFLSVAGCWYLIGGWLDRRALMRAGRKSGTTLAWEFTPQPLVLALGIYALVSSFNLNILHAKSFADSIDQALVQTWAVFLIGVPLSGLARRLLKRRELEKSIVTQSPAREPFGNFRLFEIVLGVFAALLILGVLTGPAALK